MALFYKAGRTRNRARLVYRTDGRSIALTPRVGLALCNGFVRKPFRKSLEDWLASSDSRFAHSSCFLKKWFHNEENIRLLFTRLFDLQALSSPLGRLAIAKLRKEASR